jgi:hypothetical protein
MGDGIMVRGEILETILNRLTNLEANDAGTLRIKKESDLKIPLKTYTIQKF